MPPPASTAPLGLAGRFSPRGMFASVIERRWPPALAMAALGFVLGGLERFRPELVEPTRLRVAAGASLALEPLREGAAEIGRAGRRAAVLWGAEERLREEARRASRLETELAVAREEIRRLERVSGLTHWRSSAQLSFLSADVIGFGGEDAGATLTIDRGSADGLRDGLPVVGRGGLAGLVREVFPRTAVVQTLADPQSGVSVIDLETRRRGSVQGRGRDLPPEFFPENEVQPFRPGATLITSGLGDSLFPKGLIVGRILERRTSMRGLVYGVVEPAENFSALEEVLVIRPIAPEVGESLGPYDVEMPTTGTLVRSEAITPAPAELGPAATPFGTPAPEASPSPDIRDEEGNTTATAGPVTAEATAAGATSPRGPVLYE